MSNIQSLIFYIVMFCLSVYFMLLSEKAKNEVSKRMYSIIGLAIPILISSLRWNVGTDFFVYVNMYNESSTYNTEFLLSIIMRIANILGNVQYMFAIYAILTVFFVYKGLQYNKNKHSISLTFFIYLFLYFATSFNIMRQSLAVSIIFYSYRYLVEKKTVKFIVCVLMATLVHTTAILFLPIYFIIPKKKEKQKKIQILQIVSILVVIFVILNFNTVMDYLTSISMFEKYSIYNSEISGQNRMLIIKIFLLCIFILFRKQLIDYEENNNIYIILYVIGIILEFTGYSSSFVKRIALYFSMSDIYLISSLPKIFAKKNEKTMIILGIIIYVLIMFTVQFYILNQADVIPYKAIF